MRCPGLFLVLSLAAAPLVAESELFWAVSNNDALALWTLTAEQAPPPLLEPTELGPEAWALRRGNAEALQVLQWRGVSLAQVDALGRNLLFPAAGLGRLDLFERVLAAGADPQQVDTAGQTLFHEAAASPHPEMLSYLLARGWGAQSRSSLGVTPLMLACRAGRPVETALLLDRGAVAEDEDYLGRSVLAYARASGNPEVVGLIEAALSPWSIAADDGAPLP